MLRDVTTGIFKGGTLESGDPSGKTLRRGTEEHLGQPLSLKPSLSPQTQALWKELGVGTQGLGFEAQPPVLGQVTTS